MDWDDTSKRVGGQDGSSAASVPTVEQIIGAARDAFRGEVGRKTASLTPDEKGVSIEGTGWFVAIEQSGATVALVDGNQLIASMRPEDNAELAKRMKAGTRGAFVRMDRLLDGHVRRVLLQSTFELPYGLAELLEDYAAKQYN